MGLPPPLLPLHPSHIAGNFIGTEGCVALSTSLVHLSHLKVLNLDCKSFWIQRGVGIGAEGCIALSSSLVHLSHLKVLNLDCKSFFRRQRVVGIGAEGCIALSSSLVHLSHLKELNLRCKIFGIQRFVVLSYLSAAEFCVCCIE